MLRLSERVFGVGLARKSGLDLRSELYFRVALHPLWCVRLWEHNGQGGPRTGLGSKSVEREGFPRPYPESTGSEQVQGVPGFLGGLAVASGTMLELSWGEGPTVPAA